MFIVHYHGDRAKSVHDEEPQVRGEFLKISFFTGNSPFNAIEEFKGQYRSITADLRNAPNGQSTGPIEVDRP